MTHPASQAAARLLSPQTGDALCLQTVLDQMPQRVIIKDAQSVFLYCNEQAAQDIGASPAAIVGKTDFDFFPPDLARRYQEDDRRVMASGERASFEEPYQRDGQQRWLETTKIPIRDETDHCIGIAVLFDDITEKKNSAEVTLRRAWALRALSASNNALVHARGEAELLQSVCNAITEDGLYRLAYIAWGRATTDHRVDVVACAGEARDLIAELEINWGEHHSHGSGAVGRCLRSGKTVNIPAIMSDPGLTPWLDQARRFGLVSMMATPLNIENGESGALVVFASVENAFGADELHLFEDLSHNLRYCIESRRTTSAYEHSLLERAQQATVLEHSLEQALTAIASVLEQRDPYTAGHQKHVADLAVKIGKEMGLDDNDLRGLYLSAVVHDLGKIQVPAEILSKPTRLNKLEFALVKRHPEVGYTILKNIDFPWPIADIIRQHHEYLDGSGYPRRLQGNDILLQARILTVADIVESMSSDRPYRQALGLDVALGQIRSMRGAQLDPDVVDACVRVVERGEFEPHLMMLEA